MSQTPVSSSQHTYNQSINIPERTPAVDETQCETQKPKVVPASPFQVQGWRYIQNHLTKQHNDMVVSEIDGMELKYSRNELPLNWKLKLNPEGKRYFVFDEGRDEPRFITHVNLFNQDYWNPVEKARNCVLSEFPDPISHETDIVIDIDGDPSNSPTWGYYAVEWSLRLVYWPKRVPAYHLTQHTRNPYDKSHLKLASEWQFWYALDGSQGTSSLTMRRIHVEMFPAHRPLPNDSVKELKGMLQHFVIDISTSDTSTSPFDQDRLDKYLGLVKDFKEETSEIVWIVGRLMSMLYVSRFMRMYGQHEACLDRTESFRESCEKPSESILFGIASMLLFDAPHACMNELERLYVDETIACAAWDYFIGAMQEEWDHSLIPITVLLTANVGVLAVPSIAGHPNVSLPVVAAIASGVSTAFCLGSIMICRILVRNFPRIKGMDVSPILDTFVASQNTWLGIRGLAIAFSLPTSLFIWSLISFVVALCYLFYSLHNAVADFTLTVALLVVLVLVLFVLNMHHPTSQTYPSLRQQLWSSAKKNIQKHILSPLKQMSTVAQKFTSRPTKQNTADSALPMITLRQDQPPTLTSKLAACFNKSDPRPSLPTVARTGHPHLRENHAIVLPSPIDAGQNNHPRVAPPVHFAATNHRSPPSPTPLKCLDRVNPFKLRWRSPHRTGTDDHIVASPLREIAGPSPFSRGPGRGPTLSV